MAEVSLKINGIDCAACVRRLSRALSAQDGVISAQVSYAAGRAEICYDAARVDVGGLARCINKAGYEIPMDTLFVKCENVGEALDALAQLDCVAQLDCGEQSGIIKAQLWPVGTDAEHISRLLGQSAEIELTSPDTGSAGITAQPELVRGIFAALFFSLPQLWNISSAARMVFGALALSGGGYFFRASLRAIKRRVLSPDIAAAAILTALFVLCAAGRVHFLLLTAATVLLLICRLAESRAVYALGASARRLSHMQPKTARVVQNGEAAEKSTGELRTGDVLTVLPGERFAADGVVISGECRVDESAVTGAEELRAKREGDTVLCGTLLRSGRAQAKVERTGKDTVLQRKISELASAGLPPALSLISSVLGMRAVFTLLLRGRD